MTVVLPAPLCAAAIRNAAFIAERCDDKKLKKNNLLSSHHNVCTFGFLASGTNWAEPNSGYYCKTVMFAVQTMHYSAKIYSRIGELLQGVLSDGSEFLVSGLSSGRLYSEAELSLDLESAELPPKAAQALKELLDAVQYCGKLPPIRLRSNIPKGKGLSSSSADVLAVLSVVNDYLEAGLGPEQLYRLAEKVEPTDPCLSNDIVLFHQHSGITHEVLRLPPMTLLYVDTAPGRGCRVSVVFPHHVVNPLLQQKESRGEPKGAASGRSALN